MTAANELDRMLTGSVDDILKQPPKLTSKPIVAQGSGPKPVIPPPTRQESYEAEKKSIIQNEQAIREIISNDKSGRIVRYFGASQLTTQGGERLNGVVVLRALTGVLSTRTERVAYDVQYRGEGDPTPNEGPAAPNKKASSGYVETGSSETLVGSVYEVWGFYDVKKLESTPENIGLLSSFKPELVMCVISLRSGFDVFEE
jgi:hypothetical protein